MNIESLDISQRIKDALASANFHTVEDIKKASDDELDSISDIGPRSVQDIREAIAALEASEDETLDESVAPISRETQDGQDEPVKPIEPSIATMIQPPTDSEVNPDDSVEPEPTDEPVKPVNQDETLNADLSDPQNMINFMLEEIKWIHSVHHQQDIAKRRPEPSPITIRLRNAIGIVTSN